MFHWLRQLLVGEPKQCNKASYSKNQHIRTPNFCLATDWNGSFGSYWPNSSRKFTTLETRKQLGSMDFLGLFQGLDGQLLANFSLSQQTIPQVFAKVNSSQFPSRFLSGEYARVFMYHEHLNQNYCISYQITVMTKKKSVTETFMAKFSSYLRPNNDAKKPFFHFDSASVLLSLRDEGEPIWLSPWSVSFRRA